MSGTYANALVDDDASLTRAIERLLTAAGWIALTFAVAEALLKSDAVCAASGFIFDITQSFHHPQKPPSSYEHT